MTGFDACADDPILEPSGEQTCHPSYGCGTALKPADGANPVRF